MIEFLGIGAQKAATTWLTENLKEHPQVWMPGFAKEIHYFDSIHFKDKKKSQLNSFRRSCTQILERMRERGKDKPEKEQYLRGIFDKDFAFTDEWYSHVFSAAPPGTVRGEFTPFYSALNEAGIAHVKRLMPNVKLIYLIRDPVERSISSLFMSMHRNGDKRSQQETLSKKAFWDRGDYARNIPAWEKAFTPEQMIYIPFGRVKTNPLSVLRTVETALGIAKHDKYPFLTETVHKTNRKSGVIEPESRALIEEKAREQYVFLKERFGEQFVAELK